ncbi:hypothetical protein PAXRUDRAFT_32568 [Paxillus rubicundulus Ve08.2h10]|uniref:DUF6697 domain-containing protein n=1 Tax=Paxillus rubicundulus Ve08.2h10 TaxID=930991 RepID=A0A0D0DEY4_9AGAM|nr:hypothetical protein PAXRUDRAFT_32568 [Paxillus rubicundulus Ve08.2h10]
MSLKRIKTEDDDSLIILLLKHEEVAKPDLQARSPKRRRLKVEVAVSARRQLCGEELPVFEVASGFIEKIFGDIIKKEEMLSDNVVHRRLVLISHETYDVGLDINPRDATTTRGFISRNWGGNTQSTFPRIGEESLAQHGLDGFMYLNLLFSPHALPPGFFFASSVAGAWPTVQRVAARLKTNTWLYVGQYQCMPARTFTTDEWKAQAPKVKQRWANTTSIQGCGEGIRAKIVLKRRLHRDHTKQELTDAIASEEKFVASTDETHQAFDDGDTILHSWCMKCVGYDESFQREICWEQTEAAG